MSTHFTGPLRYKDNPNSASNDKASRSKMPIDVDRDFVKEVDDFSHLSGTRYTVVKDAGASAAGVADAENGEVALTSTATTENDGASIQGQQMWRLTSGKKMWWEGRVKVSDADQMDVYAGLSIAFATNPEAVLTSGDRLGFQIDDGSGSIFCISEKDDTETKTDSGIDAADATYIKLAMYYNGGDQVRYYINDAQVAVHTTNLPDDENMAVAFMELSGDATGTKSMNIDYSIACQER